MFFILDWSFSCQALSIAMRYVNSGFVWILIVFGMDFWRVRNGLLGWVFSGMTIDFLLFCAVCTGLLRGCFAIFFMVFFVFFSS